jgi:signal transduction histidine kinase/CheY-like chemotaxis protein
MADEHELVTLIEDDGDPLHEDRAARWKIAVIDDDLAVHDGTRFALYDYVLNGQKLEILSATSATAGRELLRNNPDIAVVLLDVVMESDEAGLDLVDYIRNELKNDIVRIILRTGQPGQAPERRVIVDYDINDYKAKTELTADKLFTAITSALRSYQQLQRMAETRRGLEIIIDAASTLFDFKSMQRLAEGVLTQIGSLLNVDCAGILVLREEGAGEDHFSVLAGSGCYSHIAGAQTTGALDPELLRLVQGAFAHRRNEYGERRSLIYIRTVSGREVVVLLEADKRLSETDRALVEVLCSRLSVAFDNVLLYERLQEANARLEARVVERTRELTAANRRLAAQWERLRRANSFKREMLGKVAHDLKNPLAVITGRAEILDELIASEPFRAEKAQAQVRSIRETVERVSDMVDSLLADARADALDITIRQEEVDLAQLVQEVVDASRPLSDGKQHQVAVVRPARLVVTGDHDRLWEAIDNLVSNAIKYTPSGGRIEVEVTRDGAGAAVSVTDTGAGLSPEDMSRLFGRFQRLSAKPTAGESATGLGLSIAKRIVELHGGRISAESPGPGRGATFRITLPLPAPMTAP